MASPALTPLSLSFHRCLNQVVQCVAQAVSEGKSELREEEAGLVREEQLRLERQLEQTLADANNKGKEGGEVVLGRRLCFSHVSYRAHSTPKASFAPPDPLFACLFVVFLSDFVGRNTTMLQHIIAPSKRSAVV